MSKDFRNIVIGMLLIFIDINIVVDILPDFVGYFLVAMSGDALFKKTGEKAFHWVNRIGGLLFIITFIEFFLPMDYLQSRGDYRPEAFLLYTGATLLLLHMNNNLLSGMLTVKENFYKQVSDNFKVGEEIKLLKRSRKIYLVLMFLMAAIYAFGALMPLKSIMFTLIVLGIFSFFILMAQVYRTYKNCRDFERKEDLNLS